jgi:DNA invertase Pin-like site-specific DNA recombinase
MSNTAATYRAAAYIRLSYADRPGDEGERDNRDESNSVTNQRKLLESFVAKQPDIEIISERVDDGVSGIIFDRAAFKEMMVDIEAGLVNCVVVKDLSRLGREYIETGRYLRQIFPAYGVRFIAINDNIDTLTDSGDDLVIGVKSIVNDAYSRDASIKTRTALNIKRERGDYVGACPIYGYRKAEDNKNQLVVDDYPASIVRDIFRMKVEGMSALKIAETLNKTGVLSPLEYKKDRGLPHPRKGYADVADAKWSPNTIIRILNDETYTGTLIQGRQSTLNYKIKNVIDKPEAEWKRTEDAHEAIVSKLTFDLAQQVMRLDTRTAPFGEKIYLFSGILICGCCGARMTRKAVPYKGKKYHYYYCPTTKKKGCGNAPSLKESDLSDCILESVKAHITGVASLETILSGSDGQKATAALAKRFETQIEDNERQLREKSSFKATLYENQVNGLLSKEDYSNLKAKYAGEEVRLREAIAALKQDLDDVLAGKGERLKWTENFKHFEGLTEIDRRTVANLIQSIKVISKTELQITYNYQAEYETALNLLQQEVAA